MFLIGQDVQLEIYAYFLMGHLVPLKIYCLFSAVFLIGQDVQLRILTQTPLYFTKSLPERLTALLMR